MKRTLFVALAALLVGGAAFAQPKTSVKSEEACIAAVNKAQAAADDAKKATKVKTWMTLATACMEAYTSPQGAGWIGASEQDIKLVMSNVKPIKKPQTVEINGTKMTKQSYPTANYYFNEGGVLAMIEVTKPYVENALDRALDAYVHAYGVDPKKTKEADIKSGIQKISQSYVEEAYNAYGFNDQKTAGEKFERAFQVSLTEPYATPDTSSLYNSALMAFMCEDLDRAKALFSTCLEYGYEGKDGDVFSKLADIVTRQGDAEGGKDYLEQGFIKHPQAQGILVGLINYYLTNGQNTDRLFELLDVAKQNEPNNASLYYVEGNIYGELGNDEKAVEAYRKCNEVDPKYVYGFIGEGLMHYKKASEISEKAQNEMDDNKYMALVKDFNAEMKACIEPFEKAFNTSEDNDLKTNLADYLKSIYYRFVDEGPEYKEAYDKYNKIVKEGL